VLLVLSMAGLAMQPASAGASCGENPSGTGMTCSHGGGIYAIYLDEDGNAIGGIRVYSVGSPTILLPDCDYDEELGPICQIKPQAQPDGPDQ